MGLRIMNNVSATFAQRQLSTNSSALAKSLQKLSSGYRINSAADDAAGLAVSEKLRYQVKGLEQAQRNVMDAISMVQVAEAGMVQTVTILQRLRALTLQAANGVYQDTDRQLISEEVGQLISEIDRLSSTVTFNGVELFPSSTTTYKFQVGANGGQTIALSLTSLTSSSLSLSSLNTTITTATGAAGAISTIDTALNSVLKMRAKLGAIQNRLEMTNDFIGIQRENVMAAESRIRDVDFAEEMTSYTRNQIIVQAATSMLAQANVSVQSVLRLLQ